jgi:hypothetical protein
MTDETATIESSSPPKKGVVEDRKSPSSYVGKTSTSKTATEADELLRSDAGDIQATTVTMDRSGADQISAQRVTMDHSGAKSLETRSAQLTDSGVVVLKSEQAVLQGSSAVVVAAAEVRMVKSRAVAIFAGKMTVEGDVKTLIHFGPSEGGIRPMFDAPGALGFGAAFGVVVLLAGRLLKSLFRGK